MYFVIHRELVNYSCNSNERHVFNLHLMSIVFVSKNISIFYIVFNSSVSHIKKKQGLNY